MTNSKDEINVTNMTKNNFSTKNITLEVKKVWYNMVWFLYHADPY